MAVTIKLHAAGFRNTKKAPLDDDELQKRSADWLKGQISSAHGQGNTSWGVALANLQRLPP